MLLRVFYTGVVPYYGTNKDQQKRKRKDVVALYPGQHPALIPQDLFDQVQAVRQLRFRATQPPGKTTRHFVYPLSGLLYCGGCGKAMRSASNAKGQRYHRCATRIQQSGQCDQITVLAEVIEGQVADRFRQLILPADWRYQLRESIITEQDQHTRHQALQQSLVRARELYLEGDIGREEYERKRSVYREQLADLTNIPLTAIIAAGKLIENFESLWNRGDNSLKKQMLRALLAALTVQGDALTAWQPNSAFYPLLKHTLPIFDEKSVCHNGSDGT
jgi:hypothetical protein